MRLLENFKIKKIRPKGPFQRLGEPERKLLEPPLTVAKTLYTNTNVIRYALPTISRIEINTIMEQVDYVL